MSVALIQLAIIIGFGWMVSRLRGVLSEARLHAYSESNRIREDLSEVISNLNRKVSHLQWQVEQIEKLEAVRKGRL